MLKALFLSAAFLVLAPVKNIYDFKVPASMAKPSTSKNIRKEDHDC
jgi:hypothetical protein